MQFSPMYNSRNHFTSAAFDGASDPGVPQSDDGDNDLPQIESSDIGESINDMSSTEGFGRDNNEAPGIVDPARTRAVDPARTK
jgi:hypothetical protein